MFESIRFPLKTIQDHIFTIPFSLKGIRPGCRFGNRCHNAAPEGRRPPATTNQYPTMEGIRPRMPVETSAFPGASDVLITTAYEIA